MASKLPLADTVGMALTTLKANRLRSLLTMLGIVIGNASVITLVGVGRGAQNLAEDQLSSLGANVLFVVPGSNDTRRQGVAFPRTLVLEDATAIAAGSKRETRCPTNFSQRSDSGWREEHKRIDLWGHAGFLTRAQF